MTEADLSLLFFVAAILAVVMVCVVLAVRYGSLRGAMFGARVTRELGAVENSQGLFSRGIKARVFELEASGGARIGLEVGRRGKCAYVTLDADAARKLAGLLQNAAR